MAQSAGEIYRELDCYLNTNNLNELFTSLIQCTLEDKPENAVLFIMQRLARDFPDQVPPRVMAGLVASLSLSSSSSSTANAREGDGGVKPGKSNSSSGTDEDNNDDDNGSDDEESDSGEEPASIFHQNTLTQLRIATDGGFHVAFTSPEATLPVGDGIEAHDALDEALSVNLDARGSVAVCKLASMAKARGARVLVEQKHPSFGWRCSAQP